MTAQGNITIPEWLAEHPEAEQLKGRIASRADDLMVEEQARKFLRDRSLTRGQLVDLSTVTYEPIEWLVDGYLPKGNLVLLAGDEGIGKGLLSVRFTVDIVNHGGNVLWLSTEDGANEIRGRLGWAGWTPTEGRVYFDDSRMPMADLEELVQVHSITAVFMDPGRDFMPPPSGGNNDDSVRESLLPLRKIAMNTSAVMVFIHHTNKATTDSNGNRLSHRRRARGAGAFVQVPRHALMLQTNAAGVLGLGVFKSNLISLGHISEWAAVRVEPDGMRLMRTNVLDDTIQLSEWEAPPKEEAHPALSDEELREKVLHVLQQHQKPNGTLLGATAVWGRINPLALPGCTKVRVLDAHKALANDGFITVNGNTVRWAEDTVPRSATAA